MRILLTLSLLIFLTACSQGPQSLLMDPTNADKIIGGETVTPRSSARQYLVFIYIEETKIICTGTLIHPRVVLTTAHCAQAKDDGIRLAFGLNPVSGYYEQRKSKKIIRHDDYKKENSSARNDLALILMSQDAPENYHPALIPESSFPVKVGLSFTALGFGKYREDADSYDAQNGSGKLRQADLKIESFSQNGLEFIVDQTKGLGICNGDSGGPAMMHYLGKTYIVGVGSAVWSPNGEKPQRTCSEKSIYMNLKNYSPWIFKNLRELTKK